VCRSEYSVRVPLGNSFISNSLSSREKVDQIFVHVQRYLNCVVNDGNKLNVQDQQ
jgi:hypothetical protein